MSAKKQTKPSRKPTNKDNNLPESVQWLMDYANIGCKPGNLALKRILAKTILKRPPAEPGTSKKYVFDSGIIDDMLSLDKKESFKEKNYKKENEMRYRRELTKHEQELMKLILSDNEKNRKVMRIYDYTDENGNVWTKTPNGEIIYQGNENDNPPIEELKDFLLKSGISEGGGNLWFWSVDQIWFRVQCSLLTKRKPNEDFHRLMVFAESFVYKCYNPKQIQLRDIRAESVDSLVSGLKYTHNNTLMQVACAYILDFWHNHRELHQHLIQCKCCGRFDIPVAKSVRGRKRKYCSTKCEDRYNQASKQAVRESLRQQREKLSKDNEEMERKEMVKWLCKAGGYTPKEAEVILNNENAKGLANLKRTYGKRSGLV